ncbi:copper homeostasis protein CutC [Pseudoflavonifractor phocaeensis]|uniref:copper homeostasis protein CutC n=1 Tax=Pseudoflavonifractor phocaeensis TaxID=1870988 RepID=UPI00195C7821|nr:copper homeostasis protein CutC [Pseudoflavonifractor phocaeensis]MBM6926166.1 copper homeostasis protein CutC [Pseudoflavonifractor phocaeensis]
MKNVLIEVCCGSAEDVQIAAAAGADRVELNSALFLGGLTPSMGAMETARQVDIPIMAMVRPREGGFCYSETEFRTMLADAKALLAAGADGIVFGFLHPDGTVDKDRCRAMVEVIGDRESVFSRAIDVVPDWKAALDVLMELGVTRVLTSGQAPSAPAGTAVIREMRDYAAGRIQILPGCGVKPDNVAALAEATGCHQLHGSFKTFRLDLSATHNPAVSFSGGTCPPEEQVPVTDGAAVAAARARLGD